MKLTINLYLILICNILNAQPIELLPYPKALGDLPINYVYNRIQNSSRLSSFFKKLQTLQTLQNGTVTVVHIGDSHIQADYFSGFIREKLQLSFGDAGRGLVFPYQLAKSNAPADIESSSNITWEFNRVAHPEIMLNPGISGFVIQTNELMPRIDISIKQNTKADSSHYFNRLKFYIDTSKYSSWIMNLQGTEKKYFINNNTNDTLIYKGVFLEMPVNSFSIYSIPTSTTKAFYGVSLENSKPGVLYHSIGVNGAQYSQFNSSPLFWRQVSSLKGDLFIVSLGTNEAQKSVFNSQEFKSQLQHMVNHIKRVAPNACILITSPPDSYTGTAPNNNLLLINKEMTSFCTENMIPFWNLYMVTNGYGSSKTWYAKGLMTRDRIHFTSQAYQIQAFLLYNSIIKTYNDFVINNLTYSESR